MGYAVLKYSLEKPHVTLCMRAYKVHLLYIYFCLTADYWFDYRYLEVLLDVLVGGSTLVEGVHSCLQSSQHRVDFVRIRLGVHDHRMLATRITAAAAAAAVTSLSTSATTTTTTTTRTRLPLLTSTK